MGSFEDKMGGFEEERKDISNFLQGGGTDEKSQRNIDIGDILEGLNQDSSLM